jgi:CRISPR-associated protein (TIGR02584 family)
VPSPPTILLTVAGLSPQIVTETLWCLLVQRAPAVDVREVHVLTTAVGKRRICETLLRPRTGWFHRFCREFRIPFTRIRFNQRTIHVVTAPDGSPLEDVRSPAENASVADAVLALVRELTHDPAVALHASVAGGRKTMGLLLGIAFQLCARPQDRLSHVLVSPPDLEGHRDFFYPPPTPRTYHGKKTQIDSRDVRVELAEVPVLRLRERVYTAGLETTSYSELVAQGQRDLDRLVEPPQIALRYGAPAVSIADTRIPLTPLEYAVYWLFAQKRAACTLPGCAGCRACALEASDFDKEHVLIPIKEHLIALRVRDEKALQLHPWRDTPQKRLREVRAHINTKIRMALGAGSWADRYMITAAGKRPDTMYYLPLTPKLIRIE